jgi:autotransporter-associated beta strand protein
MPHLIRTGLICILAVAGQCVLAQTLSPVFTDNFRNGSTTGTTSIPGGTPTASTTSYNFASTKNATASAITSGTLRLTFAATTSGFAEAQAVFSSTPVRLTSLGDAINFRYTFIDTANVLTSATTWNPSSSYLWAGLYDTGTAATVPLTTLANSGLTATSTTGVVVTGGVAPWQGYVQRIAGPGGTTQSVTRPAQVSGTSSAAQDLVGNNLGAGAYNAPAGTTLTATGSTQTLANQLVIGGTYTMDYTLTLVDSSTLSVRSYLYDGSGTSGSVLVSQTRLASGANLLTTQFSGLAFGVRYSGSSSGAIVMDVTSLSIQATNAPTPPPPSAITINVASGTQTQTAAGYPMLSGSLPVIKTGDGTLVFDQANTLTGSTTVQGGKAQLANASALAASEVVPLAGGTVSLTPYLETTVGGLVPNAGGLVDVGNGKVTVASSLSAASLVTAIVAGRGDGSWTGTTGITSSVAASDLASGTPRAVGWLDNGDGSVTAAFAAPGDTNIDWVVDVLDAGNFLTFGKYDTGLPATWLEGDFNYDGVVDVLDASEFFGTGLYDTGNYNTPAGASGIAAVPEPAVWPLAAAFGIIAARGVRRRSVWDVG